MGLGSIRRWQRREETRLHKGTKALSEKRDSGRSLRESWHPVGEQGLNKRTGDPTKTPGLMWPASPAFVPGGAPVCLESPCSPLFSPKQAQTFQSSDSLEPQPLIDPCPSPYSTERSHRGRGRQMGQPGTLCTLQGSHSIATAELLAPLQDTVSCMLKRKPPGR